MRVSLRGADQYSVWMYTLMDWLVLKAIRPEWKLLVTPHLDKKSHSWAAGFQPITSVSGTLHSCSKQYIHIIDHSYGHLAYFLKITVNQL